MTGNILSTIFIKLFYRKILKKIIPNKYLGSCVYKPSCSEYAIIAFKKYNILKATKLIIGRFNRCDGKKVSYGSIDFP